MIVLTIKHVWTRTIMHYHRLSSTIMQFGHVQIRHDSWWCFKLPFERADDSAWWFFGQWFGPKRAQTPLKPTTSINYHESFERGHENDSWNYHRLSSTILPFERTLSASTFFTRIRVILINFFTTHVLKIAGGPIWLLFNLISRTSLLASRPEAKREILRTMFH